MSKEMPFRTYIKFKQRVEDYIGQERKRHPKEKRVKGRLRVDSAATLVPTPYGYDYV